MKEENVQSCIAITPLKQALNIKLQSKFLYLEEKQNQDTGRFWDLISPNKESKHNSYNPIDKKRGLAWSTKKMC